MKTDITNSTYRDVARSGYHNPECRTDAEFSEDLARVNHIVRSVAKIGQPGFNIRLLINQLITFYNVFNLQIGTELINFKLNDNSQQQRLSGVLYAMDRFSDKAHPYVDFETSEMVRKELGLPLKAAHEPQNIPGIPNGK